MVKSDDLIIPVYLNQRIVFDLVAMLQGGIAAITQVYNTEKISETTSSEGSGTFGLSRLYHHYLELTSPEKPLSRQIVTQNQLSVRNEFILPHQCSFIYVPCFVTREILLEKLKI